MTPAELRAALYMLLSPYLGTFAPSGEPAIWVGEPPADWRARGLSVHISPVPNQTNVPAYATSAVVSSYEVRLVSHGAPTAQAAAARAILRRWPDAVALPPQAPNEQLGILGQQIIEITP